MWNEERTVRTSVLHNVMPRIIMQVCRWFLYCAHRTSIPRAYRYCTHPRLLVHSCTHTHKMARARILSTVQEHLFYNNWTIWWGNYLNCTNCFIIDETVARWQVHQGRAFMISALSVYIWVSFVEFNVADGIRSLSIFRITNVLYASFTIDYILLFHLHSFRIFTCISQLRYRHTGTIIWL